MFCRKVNNDCFFLPSHTYTPTPTWVCTLTCLLLSLSPPPNSHSCTHSPASLVSQSVWWHYLVINIPDKLEFPDTAFIYITGGSNHDGWVTCSLDHTLSHRPKPLLVWYHFCYMCRMKSRNNTNSILYYFHGGKFS